MQKLESEKTLGTRLWRSERKRKSSRDRLIGRFCDIYCTVILQYSFALHAISNILWSSCYVSYGPKDTGEVIR